MSTLKCLIIEDEPLAAGILRDYVNELPGLELVTICGDVFTAASELRSKTIDVLFVDINLPKVNGLDFIKTLKGNYQVILTTAYHQYALESYNLDVVDYLLKPIEFSRFVQAINKVFERNSKGSWLLAKEDQKFYFFNVDKNQVKVFAHEIDYIESLKDYVKVHLKNKHLVTKFQIGDLIEFLNDARFLRIHKSFIINLEKIRSYNASEVEFENNRLPIGRTFKEDFERRFR